MHPTFSIVFFTTASGAGFALLFLLGLAAPLGLLPESSGFGFVALATAFELATAGLVSSVFHLGRPERAWRAFSQWRSSWLSREGVMSVLTFVPAAMFGVGWVFFGVTDGVIGLCGFLAAICAALTIACTGMIYASLKPIHQWHNRWVVPNYFTLGLMAAFLLLDLIVRFWSARPVWTPLLALLSVLLAWWSKEAYWRFIDTTSAPSTVASATALGSRGPVRMLDPPHTQDNYLLQEMGFRIARKHKVRLRLIARVAAFLLPALLSLIALFFAGGHREPRQLQGAGRAERLARNAERMHKPRDDTARRRQRHHGIGRYRAHGVLPGQGLADHRRGEGRGGAVRPARPHDDSWQAQRAAIDKALAAVVVDQQFADRLLRPVRGLRGQRGVVADLGWQRSAIDRERTGEDDA